MAEEHNAEARRRCNYLDCAVNWLKVNDDWSIGGFKNKFPRLYYVVAGLVIALILL